MNDDNYNLSNRDCWLIGLCVLAVYTASFGVCMLVAFLLTLI